MVSFNLKEVPRAFVLLFVVVAALIGLVLFYLCFLEPRPFKVGGLEFDCGEGRSSCDPWVEVCQLGWPENNYWASKTTDEIQVELTLVAIHWEVGSSKVAYFKNSLGGHPHMTNSGWVCGYGRTEGKDTNVSMQVLGVTSPEDDEARIGDNVPGRVSFRLEKGWNANCRKPGGWLIVTAPADEVN